MSRQFSAPFDAGPVLPWWRVGMVWLTLSGPAVVVVAGLATAFLAVRGADPVLHATAQASPAQAPAVQARNHAATGGPQGAGR